MDQAQSHSRSQSSLFRTFVSGAVVGIASHVVNRLKFTTLDSILATAIPGDLIEFNRRYYSHYSVYLGDGKVMDIYCPDNKNKTTALIRESTLEEVCGTSGIRVSNHDDVALKHFSVQPNQGFKIIQNAKRYEGKIVPYEFDFRNCEYYSTVWRYGIGFSTQVANPILTPVGSVVSGIVNSKDTHEFIDEVRNAFQRNAYKNYMQFCKQLKSINLP